MKRLLQAGLVLVAVAVGVWFLREPDAPRPRVGARGSAEQPANAPAQDKQPSSASAKKAEDSDRPQPNQPKAAGRDLEGYTGIVLDSARQPVAGATVRYAKKSTQTDERGRFRLALPENAVGAIHAFHPRVGAGESTGHLWAKSHIVLYPATKIRGRIVTNDGGELVDAFIAYGFVRGHRLWSGRSPVPAHGVVVSQPLYTRMRRRVVVSFHSASHDSARMAVALQPGRDADFGVMTVEPKPARGRITGRVVSDVPGFVSERANGVVGSRGFTIERDGTFDVRDLKPGIVQLRLRSGSGDLQLLALGPRVAVGPGAWVRDYVLTVRPDGVLAGRVVDHAGLPVPGVSVVASAVPTSSVAQLRRLRHGGAGVTDAAGRFSIPDLIPGPYLVAATGQAHPRGHHRVQGWMRPVAVDVGSGANEAVIRLPSLDSARGRIVDKERKKLGDLRAELIRADGVRVPIRVEANGEFSFVRPDGPGHYLVVRARNRATSLQLLFSKSASRHVRALNVEMQPGRPVEGTVYGPNKKPAAGALVRLLRSAGEPTGYREETRTDDKGHFAFPHAAPANLTLQVSLAGARFHNAAIQGFEPTDIVVNLRPRSK